MYSDRSVIGSSGDGAGPGNELSGIRYALIAAPVFPIRDNTGELIPTSSLLGDPVLYGDGNANPVAFINATHWDIQRYRLLGNVFVEIFPVKDLRLKSNLGTDLLFGREKIFKERLSAAIYDPTSLSEGTVTDRTMIWSNTIDYTRSLGASRAHQFNVLLGMEAIENRTDYLGASARNFFSSNPNFRYIDVAINAELGDINASGVATEWGLLSWFGQFTPCIHKHTTTFAAMPNTKQTHIRRQRLLAQGYGLCRVAYAQNQTMTSAEWRAAQYIMAAMAS